MRPNTSPENNNLPAYVKYGLIATVVTAASLATAYAIECNKFFQDCDDMPNRLFLSLHMNHLANKLGSSNTYLLTAALLTASAGGLVAGANKLGLFCKKPQAAAGESDRLINNSSVSATRNAGSHDGSAQHTSLNFTSDGIAESNTTRSSRSP